MKTFLMLLSFFPLVLKGIVAVEEVAKGKPGESKKQIVLDSISAAAKVAGTSEVPSITAIGGLIDGIVTSLNTSGVFSKTSVSDGK